MHFKLFLGVLAGGLLLASCDSGTNGIGFTGILEGTDVQVPAMTGGQIVQMTVTTGENVQHGQVVAVIDTLEFSLQKQQLQASLDEIRAGQAIALTREKQAALDLSYIDEKAGRTKLLLDKNSVPRQQYDDVLNAQSKIRAAYITARQNQQTLAAKEKQVRVQMALLDKKIKDAIVTSPITGTVSNTYYERGEAAMPMSPVVEVIALDPIEVKIFVSEQRLADIKIGQDVTLSVDGTDQDFTGKVIWISPKAEFTPKNIMTEETRTSLVYAVKVKSENPDGVLKHGMPVVVHL